MEPPGGVVAATSIKCDLLPGPKTPSLYQAIATAGGPAAGVMGADASTTLKHTGTVTVGVRATGGEEVSRAGNGNTATINTSRVKSNDGGGGNINGDVGTTVGCVGPQPVASIATNVGVVDNAAGATSGIASVPRSSEVATPNERATRLPPPPTA